MPTNSNNGKGLLVVLSGPSGSGKDTVLAEIAGRESNFEVSVSLTTRPPREREIDGVHYYFVTRDYFERKLNDNQILEYTEYNGNYYGTPKAMIDNWLSLGKTVVLKIEVEGAGHIREFYPDAVCIFLMPPSMRSLEERLRKRESEDDEDVHRRLVIAQSEVKNAVDYDYIVVNDVLEYAASDVCSIIRAEYRKTKRMKYMISEVIKNA